MSIVMVNIVANKVYSKQFNVRLKLIYENRKNFFTTKLERHSSDRSYRLSLLLIFYSTSTTIYTSEEALKTFFFKLSDVVHLLHDT